MTDRDERSDLFNKFSSGTSVVSQSTDESGEGQTDNTSSGDDAGDQNNNEDQNSNVEELDPTIPEEPIKDRKSVLMYLPDDVWRELDIRYDELNAKHKRQHDEGLEKNRDYYPAVIQAGLTGKDLEDILDV
ncbi:hypothetical protein LPA44_16110 [Halobacterium sp. KA-4]|uniref:hypothetical protein n=1 Tax=Halobacterium sp. KA-4 TaxID=2896367 RepID=UPI001E41F659|nr:hypothetical protein [Halobacterium sp. KA-4]MCD2201395.1 hypothetical protein [Halobacterium sp. KA-4]